MAIVEVDATIYGWFSRSCIILSSIIMILSLFYHTYQVYTRINDKKMKWTSSILLSFVLILLMIIALGVYGYVAWMQTEDSKDCFVPILLSAVLYIQVKGCLYLLLSFRLDAAFGGSKYAYKKVHLRSWRAFLAICVIMETYTAYLGMTTHLLTQEEAPFLRCRVTLETYSLVCFFLSCLTLFFSNIFLFFFSFRFFFFLLYFRFFL